MLPKDCNQALLASSQDFGTQISGRPLSENGKRQQSPLRVRHSPHLSIPLVRYQGFWIKQ